MTVTRSQLQKMLQNAIKNCCVLIEKIFQAICMQWLDRASQVSSEPSRNHSHRRYSVASCRNVFEIDGNIAEVGFDHIPHLHPSGTVVTTNDTNGVNVGASDASTSKGPKGRNAFANIAESAEPMEADQADTGHVSISNGNFNNINAIKSRY